MAIPQQKEKYPERYKVEDDGSISILDPVQNVVGLSPYDKKTVKEIRDIRNNYENKKNDYPFTNLAKAQQASIKITNKRIGDIGEQTKKQIGEITSQENTRNTLASQIAALAGGQPGNQMYMGGSPFFNEMTGQYIAPPPGGPLGGNRTYQEAGVPLEQQKILNELNQQAVAPQQPGGASSMMNYAGSSNIAGKLNFQVSDDQIINDYNSSKINQLNSVVSRGNAQIAGIQERLNTAQSLLEQLPTNDARRASSQVYVNQLKSDLASVQSAVADASQQIKDFKPITMQSPEAAQQITSFREYLQLPEERATQQLRQIDPESYRTAVGLGRQYRQMATQPLGPTTTQQTEQLRNTIEQEALNQLRLGSTLGAEERRGYEQAIRGAQTARGNIFGLGPAVQEAAQIGAAGEQRKLARYNAAQQFLGSGETSGAAAARDLLLREGAQQSRLGAAASFIGGGPSLYNLGQARTAGQQAAFQNYVQANQSLPGQFGQAPSTAQSFYQTTDQNIPVALTNAFNQLYRSQADYLSSTYGNYVGAQAQVASANSLPNYLSAAGSVFGGIGAMSGPGKIFCWVAREVYGEDNPKWIEFRNWMAIEAPAWLRNAYVKFGERIAEFIKDKPILKKIIKIWMDSKIG